MGVPVQPDEVGGVQVQPGSAAQAADDPALAHGLPTPEQLGLLDTTHPVSAAQAADVELAVQSDALPRQNPPVGSWQPSTPRQPACKMDPHDVWCGVPTQRDPVLPADPPPEAPVPPVPDVPPLPPAA